MTKISIIVPIYNVAQYLPDCIESICGQSYPNLEIILVNDGSTDGSADILYKYACKDRRIKVLLQENQGANTARNNGLIHATGEWVCFVDGDDWIEQNMCGDLVQYLEPGLDIVFYSYRYIYPKYRKELSYTDERFIIEKEEFRDLQYATLNRLGPYRFGIHRMDSVSVCDKIYRREFLKENQLLFNESLPKLQDLLFNLNVYECATRGYVLNHVYYNYRMHSMSVSHRYQEDIVQKFQVIHKYLQVFMDGHADDSMMKQAYYERIATHLRTCVVINFCNSQNVKTYGRRKEEFLKTCEDETFKEAMEKVNLDNFTFKEKVLSKMIKRKWFWACEILYKMNTISGKLNIKP